MNIPDKPKNLCMAPWVHTYLSPQTERRMCCASREPAQNFKQYIDTKAGSGHYIPITLEQHWNSDHMRSVRRRMMAGETLPECEVCNKQLLNVDVYRDYFWHMFKHHYDKIWETTDDTGATTMQPVSWDYRFSNLCNFKCRMCGDMLSSSWESEQRKHNMIDWDNPKNHWLKPDVRREISKFQDTQIEAEFAQAVEQHRVEEIYWVGGEPLMYEQHWRYMRRIIELGDGPRVYARYNTNLSRVDYLGSNLFKDILSGLRDWQICASLDGTGWIGEYIRTGLDYPQWLQNFKQGLEHARHPRQMRIDFTLTLPGLGEIIEVEELAQELNVQLLLKTVFTFSADNMWSPLILPRHILEPVVYILIDNARTDQVKLFLHQLLLRPTVQEEYGEEEYQLGLIRGKQRVLQLESIRHTGHSMKDILRMWPSIHLWWNNIDNSNA